MVTSATSISLSLKSISGIAGIVVFTIGCLALSGWAFGIEFLKALFSGFATMKPNAGLLLALGGTSLYLYGFEKPNAIITSRVCTGIVFLVSAITLAEYVFGINAHIDQILFKDFGSGTVTAFPGRMSPATAFSLLIAGTGLITVTLNFRKSKALSQTIFLIMFLIPLLALVGYMYGAASLYGVPPYSSMAVHTAFSLAIFALGGLFLEPSAGFMSVVTDQGIGGRLARRMLPVSILFPILFGWLRMKGQQAGLYDAQFGLALGVVSFAGTFCILVWWSALSAKRSEEATKHLYRIRSILSNINQTIVRVRDKKELLQQACQIAIRQGLFERAWISVNDGSGNTGIVHSGLNLKGWEEFERFILSSSIGQGLLHKVFTENISVIFDDLSREAPDESWRQYAIERNYRSLAIFPLQVDSKVIGTFGFVASVPHFFDPEEKMVLDELMSDISFALEALDHEEKRRQAEEQVKIALTEKELLLREIHHRVKNNLQIITSLFRLQEKYLTDQHVLGVFKDCQNRVAAMSLVHEQLYGSDNLASVDAARHIKSLLNELLASYGADLKKITTILDIQSIRLNIDTAIPSSLIINEIVSNSLKHAFPDGRAGEITISLHATDDGYFNLMVRDNGIGVPPDFDIKKFNSLGLRLISALTGQLKGKFSIANDSGTVVNIVFRSMEYKERI